jgi:hypothetical protein
VKIKYYNEFTGFQYEEKFPPFTTRGWLHLEDSLFFTGQLETINM